jgi:hypothetical protein
VYCGFPEGEGNCDGGWWSWGPGMDTTFILQPRQGGVSGQVGTGGPGLGAALETLLPTSEDKDWARRGQACWSGSLVVAREDRDEEQLLWGAWFLVVEFEAASGHQRGCRLQLWGAGSLKWPSWGYRPERLWQDRGWQRRVESLKIPS